MSISTFNLRAVSSKPIDVPAARSLAQESARPPVTRIAPLIAAAALLACDASTRPDPGYGTDAGRDAAAMIGDGGGKDGAAPERDGGGGSGGGADGGGGAGDGGGADGGGMDCAPACSGATPVCDRTTGTCVQCTRDAHCDSDEVCMADNHCANCTENADCTDPAKSYCRVDQSAPSECLSCEADEHCDHIAGHPRCLDTCVECKPATEAEDCGGATPRCSTEGDCKECRTATEAADCGGAEPRCNDATMLCVECKPATEGADCEAPTPSCDPVSFECEACKVATEATDCGGTTPRCDENVPKCVECKPATEAADCSNKSCDRETLECTNVTLGSQLPCDPCQSDSECSSGMGCVEHIFQPTGAAVSLGTFCFPRKGSVGCGNTVAALRPYSQEIGTESVDGDATTFCLPITSCAAVIDTTNWDGLGGGARACGTDSTTCGATGVDDGVCLPSGPAIGKCSYACTNDHDCPGTGFTDCLGAPGMCVP